MPVYEYSGMTAQGRKVRGMEDAENPRALRDLLKTRGVFLTEATEGRRSAEKRRAPGDVQLRLKFMDRIRISQISVLTRQLATLQKANIPLVESLSALIEQEESEKLKTILSTVRQKVNEGSTLASALAEHPEAFSDLYVNMIRAGETSGNLDVVLRRLTEFLDGQVSLQEKLTSAAVYPMVLLLLGIGLVGYLMGAVVPQITTMFADLGATLPLITRILIGISNAIAGWWWLMIMAAVGAVFAFRRWKATPEGQVRWDRFTLQVPIFGSLTRMVGVSRFAKTMATLLASGVPLLNALDIVKNVLGNRILVDVVEKARLNIREGESIAGPLRRSGEFPPMVTHMIAVGERTGELESMLENVAEAYDRQVSSRIAAMMSLLEPVMILGMGGTVAFIVFAILTPLLQMNQAFTQ
jgi:general secretion pathway protein F